MTNVELESSENYLRSSLDADPEPTAERREVGDGSQYAYINVASCPDCGAGMVRLGTCFSCPLCGFGGCSA